MDSLLVKWIICILAVFVLSYVLYRVYETCMHSKFLWQDIKFDKFKKIRGRGDTAE